MLKRRLASYQLFFTPLAKFIWFRNSMATMWTKITLSLQIIFLTVLHSNICIVKQSLLLLLEISNGQIKKCKNKSLASPLHYTHFSETNRAKTSQKKKKLCPSPQFPLYDLFQRIKYHDTLLHNMSMTKAPQIVLIDKITSSCMKRAHSACIFMFIKT